jgi:hypothetical protein
MPGQGRARQGRAGQGNDSGSALEVVPTNTAATALEVFPTNTPAAATTAAVAALGLGLGLGLAGKYVLMSERGLWDSATFAWPVRCFFPISCDWN